jgi:hypothetical protein
MLRSRSTATPGRADALIDLLDWKPSLDPRGEAARDLGGPPAQGHLRADGVLAEVDGARPLRTCHVLGERNRSCPRWGSVAATLDLGPQIKNLREAELDRIPRRLWLKRSRHCGPLSRGAPLTVLLELALQYLERLLVALFVGAIQRADPGTHGAVLLRDLRSSELPMSLG